MTNLQAEYSKIVEQRRHNLASEQLSSGQLAEQVRHDQATENLTLYQNQLTERGQDLNQSVSYARMALDKSISDAQLANNRYVTEYKAEVDKAINKAKLDMEEYKANITKLQNEKQNILKARELGISEQSLANQTRKTDAEISKMSTEVEKLLADIDAKTAELDLKAQELEFQYAKNPKARLYQMGFQGAEKLKDGLVSVAKGLKQEYAAWRTDQNGSSAGDGAVSGGKHF